MRRLVDEPDEPGKVLLALPGPEVDAEALMIQGTRSGEKSGVVDRHLRGGDGELRVPRMIRPAIAVGAISGEGEVLGLRGDPRRESMRVE